MAKLQGLNTSEMNRLLRAFRDAEGSVEERWKAAKAEFPQHDSKNLDEGFKAWVLKQAGVPAAAEKTEKEMKTVGPGKQPADPLK